MASTLVGSHLSSPWFEVAGFLKSCFSLSWPGIPQGPCRKRCLCYECKGQEGQKPQLIYFSRAGGMGTLLEASSPTVPQFPYLHTEKIKDREM